MGKHKGFTFVEIALFLVVTALIFIGVAGGMQTTIFQQKYNDSVQNFLEFLRDIYSEVSNTQSTGSGNSDQAIYGKMVVFGENTDLLGNTISNTDDKNSVFVYDVVGDANVSSVTSSTVRAMLKALNANVVIFDEDNEPMLASPEKYLPRWGARIEAPDGKKLEKTILVVRHPNSGTTNTLVYGFPIQVNQIFYENKESCEKNDPKKCGDIPTILGKDLEHFALADLDFCINSDELGRNLFSSPQDIRIEPNARNASSVLKIDMDSSDNRCKK